MVPSLTGHLKRTVGEVQVLRDGMTARKSGRREADREHSMTYALSSNIHHKEVTL